jgi:hypothetical protein
LEADQISIRMADTLLHLPPEQQRAQLERRLAAAREREQRSKAIADVIRGYLQSAEQIDLEALRSLIQRALAPANVGK